MGGLFGQRLREVEAPKLFLLPAALQVPDGKG